MLAGLLAALYAPAVVLNAELMPSAVEGLWWVGLLAMLMADPDAGRARPVAWKACWWIRILLGLRSGLAWLVLYVFYGRARTAAPAPARTRLVLWSGLLAPVLVAYVLLGNVITGGTLTRLSLQAYLANSGDLCQTLTLRPGPEFFSRVEKAQQNGVCAARFTARLLMMNVQAVRNRPGAFVRAK